MPPVARRRILIVDDNWFFAACLRMVIDQEADLVVCDIARSARDLADGVRQYAPDLLILDIALGLESGLRLADDLRRTGVEIPVLFASSFARTDRRILGRLGRCAFWKKGDSVRSLLRSIRRVLSEPSAPGPAVPSSGGAN